LCWSRLGAFTLIPGAAVARGLWHLAGSTDNNIAVHF